MKSFKSYLLLMEGFKEVKQKWVAEGYSEYAVDEQIRLYKELVSKNQIVHPVNDIGYWSDATFAGFGRMVDDAKKKYESSRALKKSASSKDYPVLYENDEFVVYHILSKAASCKLASNMPWCIAKENQTYYEWHKDHGYDIKYVIDKNDSSLKWAYIDNEWKFSWWNSENNTVHSINHHIFGMPIDTFEELFPQEGREQQPDYEVPLGEDDDGEWEDDYEEEPEEEEVQNDYFYDADTGTDWEPLEFYEDGFDAYVAEHKEYFDMFIGNRFFNTLTEDDEVKEKIRVLMGMAPDSRYLQEFTETEYYKEYHRLMLEEIREFIKDEMEGEIEAHPMTANNRDINPFVRARMSLFKTYPHIVLPMID